MYRTRVVDSELDEMLAAVGAVLIEGPRACGKTATGATRSRTAFRFDIDDAARRTAEVAPSLLMQGDPPILLDEWQLEPQLWNHVRRAVDDRSGEKGIFILTGSATPSDNASRHSGAGRIAALRMRPMSLFESGHSNGSVSLERLFTGAQEPAKGAGLEVTDVIDRIVTGGWPALQQDGPRTAARALRGYLDQISNVDLPAVGHRTRSPERIQRLLSTLARNVATEARITQITADVAGADGTVTRSTVTNDINGLARLMVLEDQPAWGPHLRSRTPAREAAKRHFTDPSLAVAAIRGTPERLLADLNWTGLLFESLAVRDLRVYSQPLGGLVSHFRNAKGLEVDAIVQLDDGRWAAFEVKLGQRAVDAAAEGLLKFANQIDEVRTGTPAALAVITATGMAYRRSDGVWVIPIDALGP
ncbi:ATP-binding protein [Leucobacter sp. wl10]|nr:ATP-binding protein [Leucobacter sp. wl10]